MTKTPSGIAIYHEMHAGEDFLTTAGMLWVMVRDAATRFPGRPRELFLDIAGHGLYEPDDEAAEVISFTRAALGPFLTTAPWGKTDESLPQSEQLPDIIVVPAANGRPDVLTGDKGNPVGVMPDSRSGTTITVAIYARTHGAFSQDEEI